MRDGELLPLPALERHTSESESGLWPTPQARDHFPAHKPEYVAKKKAEGHGMSNLNDAVVMWPTPLATDGSNGGPNQRGGKGDLRLSSAVHQFPTPTATNTKARHMRGADNGKDRDARSYGETGQLNPTWVEWLMGWPQGWTDLRPLATDRCRSAPPQLGESSMTANAGIQRRPASPEAGPSAGMPGCVAPTEKPK